MGHTGVGRSGTTNAEPAFPWGLLQETWAQIHPSGAPARDAQDVTGVLASVRLKKERPSSASDAPSNKSKLVSLVQDQITQGEKSLAVQVEQIEVAREQLKLQQAAVAADMEYRKKALASQLRVGTAFEKYLNSISQK